MSTENRDEIIKLLKENGGTKTKNVILPKNIGFYKIESIITLQLSKSAIGLDEKNYNMQDNSASFEGWATVIYENYKRKGKTTNIILDIDPSALKESITAEDMHGMVPKKGHFFRFLYRALRFSEQYSWFMLSKELSRVAEEFKDFIYDDKIKLINNVAKADDQNNDDNDIYEEDISEHIVEKYFLGRPELILERTGIGSQAKMYNQFPVGIFCNEVKDSKRLFTGGKSAIDLWTINNDTFYVFELKYNNKMIGIITEIFFYSNLIRDLVYKGDHAFSLNTENGKRGYEIIKKASNEKKIEKIKGYLLTEIGGLHPLIDSRTMDVLSQNNAGIEYDILKYSIDNISISLTGEKDK